MVSSTVLERPVATAFDLAGVTDLAGVADALAPGVPQVLGLRCTKGHFNDPDLAYCAVCGISMLQATRVPVPGDRPPLGVLVLDDGTTHPLVRDLVLGRAPEAHDTVAAGEASPVPVADPMVSRVHARVVLDGWQVSVVDAGSTNGTFLRAPGQASWSRVPRGAGVPLRPGTVVVLGGRQFRYHSYRNL